MKLVAVIPVRSDAHRCTRDFANTSLLENKLTSILKIKHLFDDIVVNSDSDDLLSIAESLGVSTCRRDPYYASSLCSLEEYWKNLGESVKDADALVVLHVTSPFLRTESIEAVVNLYESKCTSNLGFSSIQTVEYKQDLFYFEDKPLNFKLTRLSRRDSLDKVVARVTFGASVVSRDHLVAGKGILGKNPFFFELDALEAIEIKSPFDFVMSESIFKLGIHYLPDVQDLLSASRAAAPPKLLDCTIRDGGYRNDWAFSNEDVMDAYHACDKAGISIFEIGFLHPENNKGLYFHFQPTLASQLLLKPSSMKVAVMMRPEWGVAHVPYKHEWFVDTVRVLFKSPFDLAYYEENLAICKALEVKGYNIHMNFARGGELKEDSMHHIAIGIVKNSIHPQSITLADTFGDMLDVDVTSSIRLFRTILRSRNLGHIALGFHAHNGMENADAKALAAWKAGALYVDGCIGGFGRGAGNARTEFLVAYWQSGETKFLNTLSQTSFANNMSSNHRQIFALAAALKMHPEYAIQASKVENIDFNASFRKVKSMNAAQKYNADVWAACLSTY